MSAAPDLHSQAGIAASGCAREVRYRRFHAADIAHLLAPAREGIGVDATAGLPPPYATVADWLTCRSDHVLPGARALEWVACHARDGRVLGYGRLQMLQVAHRQARLELWLPRSPRDPGAGQGGGLIDGIRRILALAVDCLRLERIYALQRPVHPRVGRILLSIGMAEDGSLRQRLHRGGLIEDLDCWSMTERR